LKIKNQNQNYLNNLKTKIKIENYLNNSINATKMARLFHLAIMFIH